LTSLLRPTPAPRKGNLVLTHLYLVIRNVGLDKVGSIVRIPGSVEFIPAWEWADRYGPCTAIYLGSF
jgi:hypothetical protein